MKRKFLFLLLLILFKVGYAQSFNNADSLQSVIGTTIETKVGYIHLEKAPISINVPLGFFFIDREATKEILINDWGNSADQVQDVIGMILPDTTTTVAYIDKAFILSYRKVGHVNDDSMQNFSFNKFLQLLRQSNQDWRIQTFQWAWAPKYDQENHQLSIPLITIYKTTEPTLRVRSIIFGKDAIVEVNSIIATADLKWAENYEDYILSSISFNSGHTYADFDNNTESDTYSSVFAFLCDEPVIQQDKPNKAAFFSYGWLGIFGCLTGLIVLFYLASLITNVTDDEKNSIVKAGTNVLFRIGVFMTAYILSIVFGIYLLWLGFKITVWSVPAFSLTTICLLICMWLVLGTFAIFLIKPLFHFTTQNDDSRKEIQREDAPQLFKLIEETAKQSGVSKPRKIYLSSKVNACVFYNTTFWNIFFPVRKNLEVGIGLLQGTNLSELKAVISHEFGHFAQHSMRIGSIVSIGYEIAGNLVARKDWLDEWLGNWQLSNIHWVINLFGIIAARSVGVIRTIISRIYLFVQKGFMGLSRQMEYEADIVSAKTVGSTADISALCKIDVISNRVEAYNSLLTGIANSKQILPTSYWNGYNLFLTFSDSFDGKDIRPDVTILEPEASKFHSKVQLKNPWISHPTLQQRISRIKLMNINQDINTDSAISLIPVAIIDDISDSNLESIDFIGCKRVNDDEYASLMSKEIEEHSFDINLRPFFSRDICVFNPHEITLDDNAFENPISDNNVQFIREYEQAKADYLTMVQFRDKQIGEKAIRYDGKVYNRKTVPVDEQLKYLQQLKSIAKTIDMSVCQYALTVGEYQNLIIKAYDDIFYSQYIIEKIHENLFSTRAMLHKELSKVQRRDERSFMELQGFLIGFKKKVMSAISNIEMDRLRPVTHVDMWRKFSDFMQDEDIFIGSSISSEQINYVFSIPDELIQLFENLEYYSKKIITDCMLGKEPLMAWNNSVALDRL